MPTVVGADTGSASEAASVVPYYTQRVARVLEENRTYVIKDV